jgi:DNA-binding MarR family transcriptional regulator
MARAAPPKSPAGPRRTANASAAVADGLPLLESLLGYNIRRAQLSMSRDFHRSVGQGKVRPVIFSILVLAETQPGIAQVDLARQLALDKASVVALIDRLEAAGQVERRRSTQDRRRQGLFLTESGRLQLQVLKEDVARHERRYVERYTPVERAVLVDLLKRIYE